MTKTVIQSTFLRVHSQNTKYPDEKICQKGDLSDEFKNKKIVYSTEIVVRLSVDVEHREETAY